ncbi:UNVERIFIED_CONTAM: hypothetical protein GTU68_061841 [Idotea baltica]|nr:hypothetical protein [Idotea baltica]
MRRHLHQHPELSYHEKETSAFICRELDDIGIPYQKNVGGHGVVAHIEGGISSNRVIALRGDMDALPINEKNDVPYASQNEGVMHACGHDVHTSSLLGTSRILFNLRDQLAGTIKLIYQPAEELLPGGAKIMIEEGVLQNPQPVSIFGQHVHPEMQVGTIGFRGGPMMASADELYITVTGQGGHGALPHTGVDPIVVTSHIIVQLQALISRFCNPVLPSVLTIGKINSEGGATNVIPNAVNLKGTFRTLDEEWRSRAHQLLINMVIHTAKAFGAKADVDIRKGYPVLNNDVDLVRKARASAENYMGAEHVEELPIRMTSEDFAYYSHEIPACFYRLGTSNKERGIGSAVHTDTFDVDERCLEISTGLMAWLAVENLHQ